MADCDCIRKSGRRDVDGVYRGGLSEPRASAKWGSGEVACQSHPASLTLGVRSIQESEGRDSVPDLLRCPNIFGIGCMFIESSVQFGSEFVVGFGLPARFDQLISESQREIQTLFR